MKSIQENCVTVNHDVFDRSSSQAGRYDSITVAASDPQIGPLVVHGLGRLNEKERDAFALRVWGNLNFQEIGNTLGCSRQVARKRVIRGLEKLLDFPSIAAWIRRQRDLQK